MVGKKKMSRSAPSEQQKENTVYVPQPRRAEWIPTISPECLKVETWLRMKEIPYEYFEAEAVTVAAADGQLPHCKVNAKELPYTEHMLCEIAKVFNKEMPDCVVDEATQDNGSQRAFERMIESSLSWVMIYMRATQTDQLPPNEFFQGRFWQIFRPLANKFVTNKLKTKADYQGIGRLNAADVLDNGKQDLRAISAYLGDKNYFCGDKPNKLDATAFAHLCQFWYVPSEHELKTYIKEQCPNLVEYMENVKNKYWPDWEENCRKPTPSRRSKSKEIAGAANEQENENEKKTSIPAAEPIEGADDSCPAAINGCNKDAAENKSDEGKPKQQEESTVEIIKAATPAEETASSPVHQNGVQQEEQQQQKPIAAATNGNAA